MRSCWNIVREIRLTSLLLGWLFLRMAIGCATIAHGWKQEVTFNSFPNQAEIWIDGIKIGETPTTISLSRKNPHYIRLFKHGYKAFEWTIETKLSADWFFGDFLWTPLFIGIFIDGCSGAWHDFIPDRLEIDLSRIDTLKSGTIIL